MRTTALPAAVLALVAGLTLGACTSGADPVDDSTPAPSTDEAAATDGSDSNGWLCDDISPQSLRALAGGELADPTEEMLQDDDQAWVCEARDGDTPLARLSLSVGEEERAAARERAQAAEGVSAGPEYLGESYTSPTLVVGLTLCTDMDQPGAGVDEPYTMVAEALVESEGDFSEPLRSSLSSMARRLDQGIGCSPRQAVEDAGTDDGADDGAATTGGP